MWTLSTLFPFRFFAEIPDVDRQDSTRVGQFCVSRVLVGRLDEAWKKTLQVFCRKRLMNLRAGNQTRLNQFEASLAFVGGTRLRRV